MSVHSVVCNQADVAMIIAACAAVVAGVVVRNVAVLMTGESRDWHWHRHRPVFCARFCGRQLRHCRVVIRMLCSRRWKACINWLV